MRLRLLAACLMAVHPAPVRAAFEVSRSVVPAVPTFDPMAPRPLAWLTNPANLTRSDRLAQAGVARPFGLRELDLLYAEAILPGARGVLALGVTTVGRSELYREYDIGLGATARLLPTISTGLTVHGLFLQFGRGFAPLWCVAFDAGALYQGPSGLTFGLSLADLAVPNSGEPEFIQPVVRAALGHRHSPSLGLRAGAEFRDRWVFSIGETVLVANQVHLSADLLTDPVRISVGMRLHFRNHYIDLFYRDHPELGGDHVIGLGWRF